ncbi:MAG: DNA helicase II [Gammaproteobacteria bacterium]|nr:DNA helicase II [Gammaproteobacteria bacterium]
MEDISTILDGLNERQREAVTAPLGNHLIVAGAGSGKTRVLVHRIAWLVAAEGATPQSVMAVTFTNKAAAEMRSRAETLLNISGRALWVGTFHGIAHRLLRMHWQEAGLPQNFQILDADDQLRLVKRVMRTFDLDEHKWPPRQAVWFINGQKDEGRRAKQVPASDDVFEITHRKVYESYEALCQQGGLVDFAELLLRSHELWLENPELLAHYHRRFGHLLVDEFQDTNAIQYAWLRVLAGTSGRVMAVGDDDQSIYGWRGARVENIHQFSKDFHPVDVIRLEQNYRSTGTILSAANALIGNNVDRLGKELWTDAGDGDSIRVYSGYNEQDEARFIADRIQEWIDQGASADEAAILYRSNAQSRVLEEALLRSDIPYRIHGGFRFYERAEIRNALAYMRLVSDRHSDVAFERVVNTPPRGIGDKTLDGLREIARARSVSLWQATKEGLNETLFKSRPASLLSQFLDLMDELAVELKDAPLHVIAERCVEASGLIEYHLKERGERGLARKENLEELFVACREFRDDLVFPLAEDGGGNEPVSELNAFLDQAALESGEYQAEVGPSVQLMTLHSAKGLEFPLVFLSGMEEGLFPHRMSLEEPGRMEEERRLAYVGITRAMRQLYLTYAEIRRLYGNETYNGPSRFLIEIPNEYVEEVRLGGAIKKAFGAGKLGVDANAEKADGELRIGQRVAHKKFGEGVVLRYEGQGERARVQVNFAQVGSKWLMPGYANLEELD